MTSVRVVLALLLMCLPVQGQARVAAFNAELAASVYGAALAFMAPRLLEGATIPQLTDWGLRGLAAIDPRLAVARDAMGLHILLGGRVIAEVASPPETDADAWGQAAAELTRVAFANSPPLRRAGQQAIVSAFFDDIFTRFDQYSRYEPAADANDARNARRGTAGIGVTVADREDAVVVRGVLDATPAADAGLVPGDRVLSVDDKPVEPGAVDAEIVTGWINGPEDTDTALTWRTRAGQVRSATLTRAAIPPESVFADRSGGVAVLRITTFNARTEVRFAQELAKIAQAAKRPGGLILDLRGNRGGLVRQAADIAGQFLPPGVVARTEGRDPDATKDWVAGDGDRTEGLPLVVVVDGKTASAAEILAAALADRGRAVVVGSATFGKGLVQAILDLPDGGELFVSWSRVLAPSGWPVQDLGVLPQVCTGLGRAALEAEMASLDDGIAPLAEPIRRRMAARAPVTPDDALRLRAPCPAADRTDMDLAAARRLIERPRTYEAALIH